jgi:hypothetical protein
MNTQDRDERIGRIYRHKAEHRKRLAYIDAELSDASQLFKKAGAQLERLLARERSELEPVLSRINVDRVLKLMGEREQLHRRLAEADEQLKHFGVS